MKIAVTGLRHGHISSIVKELAAHPGMEVVAVAEEQPEACAKIIEAAGVKVSHPNLRAMMKEVEFDVLVVGDIFAKRGAAAIQGLEAGKHIVSDKPLCTEVNEIRKIRKLAASKKRAVMVALTMRYSPVLQTTRRLIREGALGEISTVIVTGQHPLNYRSGRPDWYFEKGMHGGTINDLMIHGVDALAWMTGYPVAEVIAARAWHVEPAEVPFFQDAAQAFLRLANGAGVMMEASYKTPQGHLCPWDFRFWGTAGDLSMRTSGEIVLRRHKEPEQKVEAKAESRNRFVHDVVSAITGAADAHPHLTSEECLAATEKTLLAQFAADHGQTHVPV